MKQNSTVNLNVKEKDAKMSGPVTMGTPATIKSKLISNVSNAGKSLIRITGSSELTKRLLAI